MREIALTWSLLIAMSQTTKCESSLAVRRAFFEPE